MSTNDRIRGRRLQEIRRRHFERNPLCVTCDRLGVVRLATELDHVKPISQGGRDVAANRQGLCADCHAVKTAQDLGHAQSVPKSGCDLSGMPTGRDHHWNR